MDWQTHDLWSQKLGVSQDVSRYVNNMVDAIREGHTLPQEYLEFVKNESERIAKKIATKRIGVFALVTEKETLKHDSARKKRTSAKIACEIQLNFLKNKGEDYVKAWYLHHALDYLNDHKDESIDSLFKKYQKDRPDTFSKEIIDFLKSNIQELEEYLDL